MNVLSDACSYGLLVPLLFLGGAVYFSESGARRRSERLVRDRLERVGRPVALLVFGFYKTVN